MLTELFWFKKINEYTYKDGLVHKLDIKVFAEENSSLSFLREINQIKLYDDKNRNIGFTAIKRPSNDPYPDKVSYTYENDLIVKRIAFLDEDISSEMDFYYNPQKLLERKVEKRNSSIFKEDNYTYDTTGKLIESNDVSHKYIDALNPVHRYFNTGIHKAFHELEYVRINSDEEADFKTNKQNYLTELKVTKNGILVRERICEYY